MSDAKLTVDAIAELQAENILLAEERTELKIKLEKIKQIVNEQTIMPEGAYPKLKKIREVLEQE